MAKRNGRERSFAVTTDEEIEQDSKWQDHRRKQQLLDTANIVARTLVVLIPSLLILGGIIFAIHLIVTNDWRSLESYGKSLGLVVFGYLIHYLQQNGLTKDTK